MVVGANGISGQYMLRVLSKHPERWSKIYSLSRRPPQGVEGPQIKHISIDLLGGVEKIRSKLESEGASADYIFFFAYKESAGEDGKIWGNQQQMVIDNSTASEQQICELDDHMN